MHLEIYLRGNELPTEYTFHGELDCLCELIEWAVYGVEIAANVDTQVAIDKARETLDYLENQEDWANELCDVMRIDTDATPPEKPKLID